jgi:integrase
MYLVEVLVKYHEMKPTLKLLSYDQLRFSVNAFEKWSGYSREVHEITSEALAEFITARMGAVSRKTISRNVGDVLTLLRFAVRKLGIDMPIPYVEPITLPKVIPIAWTVQEVGDMLARCGALSGWMRNLPVKKSLWWTALVLFLYDSGARIHAALSLDVRDFDPDMKTATLRGEHAKTGIEQVVDLSAETVEAMLLVTEELRRKSLKVFPYPWAGRKLWVDFHDILTSAGVRDGRYVGFHRLRKTHATQQVISMGWEHARVALGHSTESMTRRYVDMRQIPRQPLQIPRPTRRG